MVRKREIRNSKNEDGGSGWIPEVKFDMGMGNFILTGEGRRDLTGVFGKMELLQHVVVVKSYIHSRSCLRREMGRLFCRPIP